MTEDEFNDYLQPTVDKAEALTERAKVVLREQGTEDALLAMERAVTFELSEGERIKMLALAITIVADMESD